MIRLKAMAEDAETIADLIKERCRQHTHPSPDVPHQVSMIHPTDQSDDANLEMTQVRSRRGIYWETMAILEAGWH